MRASRQTAAQNAAKVRITNEFPHRNEKALFTDSRGAPVTSFGSLPVYEKVALDANVLFDSDRSALPPAGRKVLDEFIGKIHGLDSQSIVAIGNADRVNTVKDYLVGKGIAAHRVKTSAGGETRPDTVRDRHVSIEVSGTRIAKETGSGLR